MTVSLADVTYRYPGAAEPSLSGVSLELGPRQIGLVTGALGAGCSTLLLVAGGLAPHVTGGVLDGDVRTLGENPASKEGRVALAGRVGILLPTPWTQLSGMSFTVREEVAFGPANLGWSSERIADAVDNALASFDVAHLCRRDPQTLSGGELQRVMFAAVAAMEPELFLLDEPMQELDPENAARVYHEVLPALAERASVLLATVDVDSAVTVVDRVLVLDGGKAIADGPPDLLADVDLVTRGRSTTAAHIAYAAGLEVPYPLTVERLVRRVAP